MKKTLWVALVLAVLLSYSYFFISEKENEENGELKQVVEISGASKFELRKGDILVRPNWGWLPGSFPAPEGRKFGHVAVVAEGALGNSVDEALKKAKVIEALFYDQATKKFQFSKKDQVRETTAYVSFGEKFKGIRYRLRLELTNAQADSLICFLHNQLNGGYSILSLKKRASRIDERKKYLQDTKNENWHCAALVWEAFYLAKGVDIDANRSLFVYPADIVASPLFDLPDGRVRF